jgi:hypothetical protein
LNISFQLIPTYYWIFLNFQINYQIKIFITIFGIGIMSLWTNFIQRSKLNYNCIRRFRFFSLRTNWLSPKIQSSLYICIHTLNKGISKHISTKNQISKPYYNLPVQIYHMHPYLRWMKLFWGIVYSPLIKTENMHPGFDLISSLDNDLKNSHLNLLESLIWLLSWAEFLWSVCYLKI